MTKKLYLTQPDLLETQAVIKDYFTDQRGQVVVLDKTNFYVQGGGQPSDTGVIEIDGKEYQVNKVVNLDGQIVHYVDAPSKDLSLEQKVLLKVDQEKRDYHSRLHSAGHLLDMAVVAVLPKAEPGKGHHFPDGPYVEYLVDSEDITDLKLLKSQIQDQINNLIAAKLPNKVSFDDSKTYNGETLRLLTIKGGQVTACGGTHVGNTQELEGLKIKKLKLKNNKLKVSYQILAED